jgi:hypothetical protein
MQHFWAIGQRLKVVWKLAQGSGLFATSWSLVQGVLPSVKWSWNWKSEASAQGGCRASEKSGLLLILTNIFNIGTGISHWNNNIEKDSFWSVSVRSRRVMLLWGETRHRARVDIPASNWLCDRYTKDWCSRCLFMQCSLPYRRTVVSTLLGIPRMFLNFPKSRLFLRSKRAPSGAHHLCKRLSGILVCFRHSREDRNFYPDRNRTPVVEQVAKSLY